MKKYIYFFSGNKAEISIEELQSIATTLENYTPNYITFKRPDGLFIVNMLQVECIGSK